MSSILDALNKLEDEKEQAKEQENLIPEDIDTRSAAEEMLGRDIMRDKVTMQINPLVLIGGGLALLFALVVVVAVSVAMVLKPDAPAPQQVASIPATTPIEPSIIQPEPEPVVTETKPTQPIPAPTETPQTETEANTPAPAEPTVVIPAPVRQEAIVEEVTPEPSPTPTQEEPTIEAPAPVIEQPVIEKILPSIDTPKPAPPTQEKPALPEPIKITQAQSEPIEINISPVKTAVPAPKPEPAKPAEVNVATLPPMSPGMLNQYGLNEFTINMVNPKSDRNPYGSAIINRKKVFEDSYIAGSQLRLYKVINNGIAVEESRTGDKYFISF